MKKHLHEHLDGDLSAEALAPDDRSEADDWERMVAAFRTTAPRAAAPPWLEQRVMAEIDVLPREGIVKRALDWLVRPAPVRVPPLAAGLAAAVVAALLLVPRTNRVPEAAGGASPASVVYVQFTLEAPNATSVAVAGDFSEWEPAFTLEDTNGDGVWTGRVPIQPGVHGYMFLIDGTEWATDPRADRYQDDGFGNQNAVLAVAAGV